MAGIYAALGNPQLGQSNISVSCCRMRLSPFSTVLWLVCFGYCVNNSYAIAFTKAPAGIASVRGESWYTRPPAIVETIQFSSSYRSFHPFHASRCEAQQPHALRHAILPVQFPFRISRGMIGCGFNRSIPSLLLAQGKINNCPAR